MIFGKLTEGCYSHDGHIIGCAHYTDGDIEEGDNAIKTSTRSVGVFVGGIWGFVIGGPIGSVVGGVAGGAAMDGIITAAESARKYVPSGHLNFTTRAIKGELNAGGGGLH